MANTRHKFLKLRAKAWLRSKGCKDIREEVSFFVDGHSKVVIDIVGYKDEKPAMGIECGTVNHDSATYRKLEFPVFALPYAVGYEYVDTDNIEVREGRPWALLNGSKGYSAREKILEPRDIWREKFEQARQARKKERFGRG